MLFSGSVLLFLLCELSAESLLLLYSEEFLKFATCLVVFTMLDCFVFVPLGTAMFVPP